MHFTETNCKQSYRTNYTLGLATRTKPCIHTHHCMHCALLRASKEVLSSTSICLYLYLYIYLSTRIKAPLASSHLYLQSHAERNALNKVLPVWIQTCWQSCILKHNFSLKEQSKVYNCTSASHCQQKSAVRLPP